LTATELKIARMVSAGSSNPDIAAELVLSCRTVEVHVSHILTKLGARSPGSRSPATLTSGSPEQTCSASVPARWLAVMTARRLVQLP
jgi:DNA-binding NarL/FixJ family response regulator